MRNKRKLLIIGLILVIMIVALVVVLIKIFNPTIRAVVVKAYQNSIYPDSITVMDIKDKTLYSISLPEEINIQFKQGQEVLIYTTGEGIIELTNPAHINSDMIKKIEIVKENSSTKIPENILRSVYNNSDNIIIFVDEFIPTKLTLTIKDTNPYKAEYEYSNMYYISDREISTYNELQKNDGVKKKIESINIDSNTIKNVYNWEDLYGKLEDGAYQFQTSALGERMRIDITINFTVNKENETITYDEPMCTYIAL